MLPTVSETGAGAATTVHLAVSTVSKTWHARCRLTAKCHDTEQNSDGQHGLHGSASNWWNVSSRWASGLRYSLLDVNVVVLIRLRVADQHLRLGVVLQLLKRTLQVVLVLSMR